MLTVPFMSDFIGRTKTPIDNLYSAGVVFTAEGIAAWRGEW
jgi:hypothetical protein